ncbi:uncharacterized protein LOC120353536 [Nilaparvata lugens]|uniref:uncharacterized protein LOC120353536 n=1 Tax=Nilaparvata lugens TaxID=108931 RepID=UPI00193E45D2|nr:uncharacterized protein LOC120353536 [Nilaparvata lugens]
MDLLLISLSLISLSSYSIDAAIYVPKHGHYLSSGIKSYSSPFPVKLVKVTNTVAVPVPYPVHITKTVPYPVTVHKPFPFPVPHPLPVEITKPVIIQQAVPVPVPKPVAVPKPILISDGLVPPSATGSHGYLGYSFYGLSSLSQPSAHDSKEFLFNRGPITFQQRLPGPDYDYTAPPDVSSQASDYGEGAPSQDFQPPPNAPFEPFRNTEFEPFRSAEFENVRSAEFEHLRSSELGSASSEQEKDSYFPRQEDESEEKDVSDRS